MHGVTWVDFETVYPQMRLTNEINDEKDNKKIMIQHEKLSIKN